MAKSLDGTHHSMDVAERENFTLCQELNLGCPAYSQQITLLIYSSTYNPV
jgi:hypothetical protein